MPQSKKHQAGHTGQTTAGNTRDIKVERVGKVTIYKRGDVYYLYHRQDGVSQRRRVQGNLAVARATAHKVTDAMNDGRPSPIAYLRTSPDQMIQGYLDTVTNAQKLALRTQDRYRAALDRFRDFCHATKVHTIDSVQQTAVEEFVKWLRGQKRTRNGATKGKKEVYETGGIKFILSTCRTAFSWAARHRMLPPFIENPFKRYPIDKLRDPAAAAEKERIFTPEQERAFFAACSEWQHSLFLMLSTYGLRVGELTHLLIEDLDLDKGTFWIRSKPELFWTVKTGRQRVLPVIAEVQPILIRAVGARTAGFVFLNDDYVKGQRKPVASFGSGPVFRAHLRQLAASVRDVSPQADDRQQRRAIVGFCRSMGQMPEKRVRMEFIKLTERIGCPEFTRAHDLRHLFCSRAQAGGVNPLLVQELLGHTTLEMTRRYTHLGIDLKREALQGLRAPLNANAPESGVG